MPTRPHHVFVVDADPAARDALAAYLERHGLAVTPMAGADALLRRIHRLRPDLVVLDADAAAPGEPGGLQACQRLRADGDRVPIVLVGAQCGEVERVLGLELGADDVLAKPFSPRELLARVRAVLRRCDAAPALPLAWEGEVPVGRALFRPATRTLQQPGGTTLPLATVEYAMLAELVRHPGVPISRERLLAVSHPRGRTLLARTADVAVMRLRRLVEADPALPLSIQTVRGHGYMFVPPARPG